MDYLLLSLSVLLTALGQLWQKLAARRLLQDSSSDTGRQSHLQTILQIVTIRETWFALFSLAGSMLLWLWVLYGMDVSKAFPVISMSLVLVLLISRWKFGEYISPRRWLGAIVITIGVCLVAGS